ncbi:helix-turn-helix transcriptional regulator [Paenibacillus xerothermodurans]|uniref:YafY family transcriptional regulator n=1 Tax=Paenibacillus xerothermodurans TaxID=1977292 RepID=A0A2W1NL47_PAEXE|nr:YafY family protein [Paenibacillus xerothermodurans]PZE20135.1 YafY family transcriptional regulator [Paenibacillus xerothermodurans]
MKLDRLLAITMLLLNRKRVTAKELTERFEVSVRTIYRDLECLNQAGIPIVSFAGASGGYEIMDQYRLERQYLSMEELQAIVIALKGVRSSLDDTDIGGLLDKVGALVAKSERNNIDDLSQQILIDINPWYGAEVERERLTVLRAAIRDTKLIQMNYINSQGETSERECEPMGMVLKGYVWYLYGFCRLRHDYRIFRLSRIDGLTVLSETFERKHKPLDQLDVRWNRPDVQNVVKLVLQFQPRVKSRVRDYFGHAKVEDLPDGTVLVTSVQPEEPWLYSMLLSYGPDVKICEPISVAEAVAAQARKIVELYRPTLT